MIENYDVIILGGGASGLFCATEAAKRNKKVAVLEQNTICGSKLLVTGGGKCNFTNYNMGSEYFVSENPHFCKSALSRFSQWDFLALVTEYGIAWEERAHGQLFTISSARDIRDLLLHEARDAGASIRTSVSVSRVHRNPDGRYLVDCNRGLLTTQSLVVATGGLSYPSLGAGPFGYRIAQQFGIPVTPLSAGLVPFTLPASDKEKFSPLSGIAIDAEVESCGHRFRENLLFTHRGLSGPVILQISNYWEQGSKIQINLLPERLVEEELKNSADSDRTVISVLSGFLPKRLVSTILPETLQPRKTKTLSAAEINEISGLVHRLSMRPLGTEGYRSAEATRGGVSTHAVSSKSFESRDVPGLYFIGEVLDVTGSLGGYNLQWAWSSGCCAGKFV